MAVANNGRPRSKAAADESPEIQLEKIIQGPTPKYRAPVPDDDEIALELAESLENRVSYFHNGFYEYEHGYWNYRDSHEVYNVIRAFLRPYRSRGVKVKSAQITSLMNMMESDLYKADRTVTALQLEGERYINMRNGLYDLEVYKIVDHRPELMLTNQLDFDYDPRARCPTFDRFLASSLVHPDTNDTDGDMVAFIQQALGYSLTAWTDLKASFWLKGVPNSGKSTILALIKALMGNLGTVIDLNQLGTKSFMLADIIGKRTVSFSESSSNVMLPDALYKAMVGGVDELWADVKGKQGIVFKPIAKFWWAMNEMPRISDRSGATFNRLKLIRFNRSFNADQRDLNLLPKLISERSGIFNRLIDHYQYLRTDGWITVKQSDKLLEEYELENDTERSFVEDRCERDLEFKIQSSALYAGYSEWCLVNGFKAKNRNQVATEWRRLGFKDHKSNGVTIWIGLRLRSLRTTA